MKNKNTFRKNIFRKNRKSQRKSKNTRIYNLKKMTGGALAAPTIQVIFEHNDMPEMQEQVQGDQNIYDTVINRLIQEGVVQRYLKEGGLDIQQGNENIDPEWTFGELGNLDEIDGARFNMSFQY